MTTIEISDETRLLLEQEAQQSGSTTAQLLDSIVRKYVLTKELEKGIHHLNQGVFDEFDLEKLKLEARAL
ncbi:MAG: hypothetical protein ACFCU1_13080 [Sumerlaeia bacterium]